MGFGCYTARSSIINSMSNIHIPKPSCVYCSFLTLFDIKYPLYPSLFFLYQGIQELLFSIEYLCFQYVVFYLLYLSPHSTQLLQLSLWLGKLLVSACKHASFCLSLHVQLCFSFFEQLSIYLSPDFVIFLLKFIS